MEHSLSGTKHLGIGVFFLVVSAGFGIPNTWGEEASGKAVLERQCSGCHAPKEEGGKLDTVEFQRKTPEGWEMTIDRMRRVHGAQLQPNDMRVLVKYLSDQYGLAPAEVEPFRYALEKRNSTVEQEVPQALKGACVQCHSYARIALQRRAREQWERLPDLKAALMPNMENQTASAGLLQDFWYSAVKKESTPYLVKNFAFTSEAWKKWQAASKPDYAGSWKVVGHDPGKGGDYTGQLTLKALGDDRYEGEFTCEFADGSRVSGKTTAIVYTGFQWRGIAQLDGGKKQKEIFFANEAGTTISGRRLLTEIGDLGMDEMWYKSGEKARLLSVTPPALRTGETQKVKIFGMNFPSGLEAAAVSLGAGIKVQSVSQSGDDTVVAEVVAEQGAAVGSRQVKVQGVDGTLPLHVYRAVDYIRLSPEQAFSRPGGERAPKISQQFEAVAYLSGKDGVKGTKDDVKLGRVAPIKWNLQEYVKRVNDDDVRFVGTMDENGLFTPAKDGPNSQRHMLEHNVGDVWVEAWYKPEGAKRPMGARAFLLVMPERFNFQPIE
jgi:quinohemoprotein amine dehydrogenase